MTKPKPKLSAAETLERFAQALVNGKSPADAYRAMHPRTRMSSDAAAAIRAQAFIKSNNIAERVAQIVGNRKLNEIYTPQQWLADALVNKATAVAKGNHNAAQSYHRQIGQAIGVIGGEAIDLHVSVEKLDDKAIIDRLSKGNPELQAVLAKTAGKDSFIKPSTDANSAPQRTVVPMKKLTG